MKTLHCAFDRSTHCRNILILLALLALAACSTAPPPATPSASHIKTHVDPLPAAAPAPPASRTLDAYKVDVARHIMDRNPERIFDGRLPPMLPAIVVLAITVDGDGRLTDVRVQRSRDQGASEVALASLRRCGPLPKPHGLAPPHGGAMTFSETFLFAELYRFQLRSLAGPQ